MTDLREYSGDPEEMLRVAISGELKKLFTAMPVIVSQKSQDGHTVELKMSVRGQVITKEGKKEKVDVTVLQDVPVHFAGGGGVTMTHPVAKEDEGVAMFLSRPQDSWFESGDVQDPIDNRMFALSDARFIPGGRSKPRKLKNVSTEAAHLRSDDGKHTFEQHPKKGMTAKSVHPDDQAKDPFKDSKKHHQVQITGEVGFLNESVDQDQDKVHKQTLDYDNGHVLEANNGKHKATIHPDTGPAISADDGQHKIEVKSGDGVKVTSAQKFQVDAPNIPLNGNASVSQSLQVGQNLQVGQTLVASLASLGGIGGMGGGALNSGGGANSGLGAGAMQTGAAATNVGTLGGDLAGMLPNPTVVGLTHISNAHTLPDYANDAAAATGGVAIGQLYRTGSVLKVRVA